MALSYSFSNLFGAPYEGGNVAFCPDGSSLAAPCGNRVSIYDLHYNKVVTLPFEARQNIKFLCFAPNSSLLLTIDESGRCLIINFTKGIILNRIFFKTPVSDAKFSLCGSFFAVALDRKVRIWQSPKATTGWQLSLHRDIRQHLDKIVSLDWSFDSKYLVTASKDLTVRIFSRDPIEGFSPTTFVDHRYSLCAAYFTRDMKRVISLSRDGAMISWRWWSSSEPMDEETEASLDKGLHLNQLNKSKGRNGEVKEEVDGPKLEDRDSKKRKIETNAEGGTINEAPGILEANRLPSYTHGKWAMEKKVFCNVVHKARVVRSAYHLASGLLVVGYSNGVVGLYEIPSFDSLHTLSIGNEALDSVGINKDGEWLAMASSQLGQLVVWEWRSETYLLKQQSHNCGVRCAAIAPTIDAGASARGIDTRDGPLGLGQRNLLVITGGEDGKVKLWDLETGFNFMTFAEHTAPVNDVVFTPQGNALVSASSDGSVRAFDLARYRNFRTFTSEQSGVQFLSVAVDGGGEVVVAGGQGAENCVYVWSIQSGKLLEKLSGHQAAVVSVQFHPHPNKPGILLSGSWDSTIRVWDVFGRMGKGGSAEALINTSGVLCVAFDPRGNNQLAAATLSGNIWFWDCDEGTILASIDGLRDIQSGRRIHDKFTANNTRSLNKKDGKRGSVGEGVNQNQHFTSITYSSNGLRMLATAKGSARVCVYDTNKKTLIHVFQLTRNLSLDGILLELNSKFMTESGFAIQEFDLSDSGDDDDIKRQKKRIEQHLALPGAQQGELKGLNRKRQLNCWQLAFAQNGQMWCAATSHGLFIYTVDPQGSGVSGKSHHMSQNQLDRFAPNLLTRNVSPKKIEIALVNMEYAKAMILALALNDYRILNKVYIKIPYTFIGVIVQSIPPLLIPALLNFLRVCLSDVIKPQQCIDHQHVGGSPHLQYHIKWLNSIFSSNHLSSLQQFDKASTLNISTHQKHTEHLQLGIGTSDLRSLCLLLLQNIQRVHNQLNLSFGNNLQTIDFILQSH